MPRCCFDLGTKRSFIKPLSRNAPCGFTDTVLNFTISPSIPFGRWVVAISLSSPSWYRNTFSSSPILAPSGTNRFGKSIPSAPSSRYSPKATSRATFSVLYSPTFIIYAVKISYSLSWRCGQHPDWTRRKTTAESIYVKAAVISSTIKTGMLHLH